MEAVYTFGRKDKRRRDLGNMEKVTSDLLVKWGALTDDSQIVRLTLEWGDVLPGYVRVELKEKAP